MAAALNSKGGSFPAGMVAAMFKSASSSRSVPNCAAVSRHDSGAPAGDQAEAIMPAWSATTRGSVAKATTEA